MDDLNDYIKRHLRTDSFFAVEPLDETIIDFDDAQGPQWHDVPDGIHSNQGDMTFPRVIPPERKPRKRVPMAHDGGPGVADHSLIKSVLRRSGML